MLPRWSRASPFPAAGLSHFAPYYGPVPGSGRASASDLALVLDSGFAFVPDLSPVSVLCLLLVLLPAPVFSSALSEKTQSDLRTQLPQSGLWALQVYLP